MKKFVLLVIALCFFCFACSPSEEDKRAEVESRIYNDGHQGKELQKATEAIMKQLENERQENITLKKSGGGRK